METLTREEAYKTMIDGEKIGHPDYPKDAYCDYDNRFGYFMYHHGGFHTRLNAAMSYANGYIIYKKFKKWINIYSKNSLCCHDTKEKADERLMSGRLACIEIEYCEGDGLE